MARVDVDGYVDNPYARMTEWGNEKVFGATSHAHDGLVHTVEPIAWANLIDTYVLAPATGKSAAVGEQIETTDGSMNFVLDGVDPTNVAKVATEMARRLPAGCEMNVGDPRKDATRTGVARRPHDHRIFYIKVTQRAQANLEERRRTSKNVRKYDCITLFIGLLLVMASLIFLRKHGEGYRDPFNSLADHVSGALGHDSVDPKGSS